MKKIITIIMLFQLCSFQKISTGVVVVTIPKCGTNLLGALLKELGFIYKSPSHKGTYLHLDPNRINSLESNTFIMNHAIPSKENLEILAQTDHKIIFMYRDPRDQIVSCANYMKHGNRGYWCAEMLPFDILISELIKDYSILSQTYNPGPWSDPLLYNIGNIRDFYHLYLPWMKEHNVCSISFERLIGIRGGGSEELQHAEIKKICTLLDIEKNDEEISQVAHRFFGKGHTFFKGEIGAWKNMFSSEQKSFFLEIASDLLLELGYELDNHNALPLCDAQIIRNLGLLYNPPKLDLK